MAKIVFISRSKPSHDPRFNSLSKLLNSLAPEYEQVFLTKPDQTDKGESKISQAIGLWVLFKIAFSAKVKLIIFNDADYKIFMCLLRILFAVKTLYDQQENIEQNILWNTRYKGIRLSTLLWITRNLNHFHPENLHLVAERVYIRELSLAGSKKTILYENYLYDDLYIQAKDRFNSGSSIKDDPKELTYFLGGTLGPHYGSLDAVNWHLSQVIKGIRQTVTVVGFAPWPAFRQAFGEKAMSDPSIKITSSLDAPVRPEAIYHAMQDADITLLPYRINGTTRHRIPSKLRESLALNVPVAITENPAWERLLARAETSGQMIRLKEHGWEFRPVEPSIYREKVDAMERQQATLAEALRALLAT